MKHCLTLAAGLAALLGSTTLSLAETGTTTGRVSASGQVKAEASVSLQVQARSIVKDLRGGTSIETVLSRYNLSRAELDRLADRFDFDDLLDRVASNTDTGTAGRMMGNPGNNRMVGRAGESPNGKNFGSGVRGRSDVTSTGSVSGNMRQEVNRIQSDLRKGVALETILDKYGITRAEIERLASQYNFENLLDRTASSDTTMKDQTQKVKGQAQKSRGKSLGNTAGSPTDDTTGTRSSMERRDRMRGGTNSMMGNPGNNRNVGRAGESPNGMDFGNGTRGRSDVSRGSSGEVDSTGSVGGSMGGQGSQGGRDNGSRGADNGGGKGDGNSGNGNGNGGGKSK